MEIRIGVQHAAREISLESNGTPEEVGAAAAAAIADGSLLRLADDKGRIVLIPGDRLAYIEIGPATARSVGFAN